ncbi:MAG: acetylglutamate kinase [Chloroflexi bacterium]|nr:acetylglutamate kinase [Chloroflexota bacterium]
MADTLVVKIGGSTLGSHDTTLEDVVALQREGRPPIVVHGGGAVITEWLKIHNIPTRFVRGLRVTDAESVKIVTAVLSGLVNKELVAAITALGGRAVGLSGADGGMLEARLRDPELGYVGDIERVNLDVINAVLAAGFIPVISPVSLGHDGEGQTCLLNINADTAAGEIAAALPAERLVFMTDVAGVMDGDGKLIERLTPDAATALIASGTASGGMIPKLEACLRAAGAGADARIIDGREGHALLGLLAARVVGAAVGSRKARSAA